ncbi:MAG: dehydrogenase [Candidatus Latescibacteria bacterium]|nr:dehydrogenase [Candidatus Latescibacterota bacterium]
MSQALSSQPFNLALSADFFTASGEPQYKEMGLDLLAGQGHIHWAPFAEHRGEVGADQIDGVNGLIALTPAVTAKSLQGAGHLLAIARFGVGYDMVDVPACTEADVALLIATGAVDRPVAEATVGWMIALTHHMRIKDQLLRQGRWAERSGYMGRELRQRTFGAVGLGGIARAVLKLLAPFDMNPPLAFDPYADPEVARSLGVELVELDALMERADFVSVHCPLNDQTKGLIGAEQLARMKGDAYLINTARGGIVDEEPLYQALAQDRIAGAALDCFVGEPIESPHPFGELDNVLLAPHSIAWTDELFRDIGRMAVQNMIDLSLGRPPRGVVNPEVLQRPGFQEKWNRVRGG